MSFGNPQTDADWAQVIATFLAFCAALVTSAIGILKVPKFFFATFQTQRQAHIDREDAEMRFVKIVNPDGTRSYSHPDDLIRIDKKLDRILDHLGIP